ncbi:hypothetical protein LTR17_013740 [Elasticomyces elasticus]|nr:hypothetical protein LTR17_013740 [Elasticomyces elasticus]
MAETYSRASCVLIWLGESGESNSNERGPFNEESLEALSVLARGNEGWWKRLWIVQELLLCSNLPLVHFGPNRFQFGDFIYESAAFIQKRRDDLRPRLAFRCVSFGIPGAESEAPYPELRMLWRIWLQFQQEQRRCSDGQAAGKLYDLMVEHRSRLCSVSHDQVYALLSLTVEGAQKKFVADYKKPIDQLYAEVTGHFVESVGYDNGSWPILFNIWELGVPPLPTWSLDFRELRPGRAGALFGFLRQKACGHSASIKLGVDSRSLQTQLILLDQIASVWDLSEVLDMGYPNAWLQLMRVLAVSEQSTQRRIKHANPSRLSDMRQSHWSLLHDFCVLSLGPYADDSALSEIQNAIIFCEATYAKFNDETQLKGAGSRLENALDAMDDVNMDTCKSWEIREDLRQLVLFTTEAGLVGLALSYELGRPQDRACRLAQEGDMLAMPCGSPTPVILRREPTTDVEESSCGVYQLVNACFVPGVAQGKACSMHDDPEHSLWATLK